MEKEIECPFPHIQKKGLKLKLYHCDELAGKVYIDSDADAVEALRNFTEESLNERRPMYMILRAEDVIVLSSPTMTPATQSAACTSDLNPRKVPNNATIIITLFSLYSVLSQIILAKVKLFTQINMHITCNNLTLKLPPLVL